MEFGPFQAGGKAKKARIPLICCYLIERSTLGKVEFQHEKMLQKQKLPTGVLLPENCSAKGCKIGVPSGLAAEHLCILHFTLFIEAECAEMRRETALGKNKHERQVEFMQKVSRRGETLVNTATSGFPMSDELKARVLSTLLTLMNTRENMDRAAMRQSADRRFVG